MKPLLKVGEYLYSVEGLELKRYVIIRVGINPGATVPTYSVQEVLEDPDDRSGRISNVSTDYHSHTPLEAWQAEFEDQRTHVTSLHAQTQRMLQELQDAQHRLVLLAIRLGGVAGSASGLSNASAEKS